MRPAPNSVSSPVRTRRSERFLDVLAPFERIVLATHVNPNPDALASMLGLETLLTQRHPGKTVIMTLEGMVARAENQAMVDLLPIPLVPIEQVIFNPATALVMVDTQPRTGRRSDEAVSPQVVLDHHETPGDLEGVPFIDVRPNTGATSTMVTGYLLEQKIVPSQCVATALMYGIESEISGYPREAGPSDDGALVWLFSRADKDLLARIRNPRLPQSYFETFQHALGNAFLYGDVIVAWCGQVPQPDIVAELADFFIRFEQVSWALALGRYDRVLKLSLRSDHIGGHCGEILRDVVEGLGTAGGHDRRAGGAIDLIRPGLESTDELLRTLRHRFLARLGTDEHQGVRLLEACPVIQAP